MATATAEIHRLIHIILDDEEAGWLQALLQNPLPGIGSEPALEKATREAIWQALQQASLLR